MIIWRGLGFLVPIIAIAMLFVVTLVFESVFPNPKYIDENPWTWMVLGICAAAPLWFIGRILNNQPGRTLIDKETGEETEFRRRHDLFFISMELWGLAAAVIGVIAMIVGYTAL